MHIVIVTPYYAPAWSYGGPPKVLSILAAGLVKLGNSVSVITTDSIGEKRTKNVREVLDGVTVYRFSTISNTLAYKYKIFYVPDLLNKCEKILEGADRILFSDVRSILNWQLYSYVTRWHIPYGVFAFGQIPYGEGLKSVIKKIFDFLWVKKYISLSTWRFSQTEHERKMFQVYFGIPKTKTQLSLLPVESHRIKSSKREKIILFVGRFHILKGVDILIR